MGSLPTAHGGVVNPKHPVYARILELVQRAEINSCRVLAGALGVGLSSAMDCVSKLEDRGLITRTQNGVFVALGQEPKSGLFFKPLPLLTKEQRAACARESLAKTHAENRLLSPPKRPYRPRRSSVLSAVIGQSEAQLKDAPPDDPELGRLIVAKKQTPLEKRQAKRAAGAAAGRARFEAMERAHAERLAANALAKEARREEKARLTEGRRAARAVIKAVERLELEARRVERGMRSGRCKYCKVCMDLGERRPLKGPCPGCGEVYERENLKVSASLTSSIAMFDGH
jgi:hypothetical protein